MSDSSKKRISKFANHNVFASVDKLVTKAISTGDEQDSWNRFASDNRNRYGLKRSGGYTSTRHAPAFPKLGHWHADPTGINDGTWKSNSEELIKAAEVNRRKKIWEDEQKEVRNISKTQKSSNKRSIEEATRSTTSSDVVVAKKKQKIKKKKKSKVNSKNVFLTFSIDGRPAGTIKFTLFDSVVPKTAENFRMICLGNRFNKAGRRLHYKDCPCHRIIRNFMVQGGDITAGDGTGGESIYGRDFEDENFSIKHTKAGLLSMANSGPGTNNSQFFITTNAASWLDGKHVVFGELIDGFEVLSKLNELGSETGEPMKKVVITNCGSVSSLNCKSTLVSKELSLKNRKIEDNAISTDPHAAAMEAARQAMMRRKLVGGTAIGTKPPEQITGTSWMKCTQPNTTRIYYYNSATGDSTWNVPEEVQKATGIPADVATNWLEASDPQSGRTYYYHRETKEVAWTRPTTLSS